MENASKALIIAGGVFLALMIISLIIYLTGNIREVEESKIRIKEAKQITEFNNEFLAYNKTRMYGTDVLTVYNKAQDEKNYVITIIARNKENNEITIENEHDFKMKIFKCVYDEIEYNEDTGRISKMVFTEI